MNAELTCRCVEERELWDEEAFQYARTHLRRVQIRADGWEVLYRCPETNAEWLQDNPHGELHGGGPVRLRRLT